MTIGTGKIPEILKSAATKQKEKLWELCKQITRKRWGNICYTCGAQNLEGSNWHTGHFITDSTCSTELSYDLDNLRPQCYACNIHRSGYWVEFERRMIQENGAEWVEALKQRNRDTKGNKYGSFWITQKIEEYKEILNAT